MILEYQRDGKPETWQKIVLACLPLIDSLIRKFNFQIYEEVAALRNECVLKLFKAIRHYNPDRGRAFTVLTIAFTRFLISYVQTLRTRSRRFSLVADEILEQYEGPGQGRTELPEELKTKIQAIRTRFKSASERGALKLLINYFLLEGFSQPRKLVLETVRRQFALSLEKADTLYDYALVSLRSVLHEFYTPAYSPAEIHGIIGEQCFARLLDIFAGVTASFPSKAALEKMRKSREFLNRLGDEKQAFSPSSLANPQGQMMFDPNGRISFMVTRADLPKFASNNRQAGTPEENKASCREALPTSARTRLARRITPLPSILRAARSRIGTGSIRNVPSLSLATN